MKRSGFLIAVLGMTLALTGCSEQAAHRQPISLFVGLDVSGSFYKTPHFADSIEFLSLYLYGHLQEVEELHPLKVLYVGPIGGTQENEPKSFRPIDDFRGKSPAQIKADLLAWFPRSDAETDFNMFFRQVTQIAQKRNLALRPIEIVLFTDGVPDTPGGGVGRAENIDLTPIEYLSRHVTVRLLYPNATWCSQWENAVSRQRVRLWTVDDQVMEGWKSQLKPDIALSEQKNFWKWVTDNVDYRVPAAKFHIPSRKK